MPPFGAVVVGVSFLPGSINLTGCIGRASVPVRRGAQCSSAVCTDALDIGLLLGNHRFRVELRFALCSTCDVIIKQ